MLRLSYFRKLCVLVVIFQKVTCYGCHISDSYICHISESYVLRLSYCRRYSLQVINWKLDQIGMNPSAEAYLILHRFGAVRIKHVIAFLWLSLIRTNSPTGFRLSFAIVKNICLHYYKKTLRKFGSDIIPIFLDF